MKPPALQERCRLKYAASINVEALSEDTAPDFELNYIDIGNVDSSGNIQGVISYLFENAPSRARRRVRHGDVIISTVRTYLQAIAPIENPPDNLIVSTGFAVIRPSNDLLDAQFCKYALREPDFLAEVEKRSVGVSYPAINASEFGNIYIHLPTLAEQQAIANFLDRETTQIDALIAAKQRLLGLLAEKRRALITHAITRGLNADVPLRDSGLPWLGEVPAHWQVERLRWFILSLEQGWSPQAEEREPTTDQWAVLKLNAVNSGTFDDTKVKALPPELEVPKSLEIRIGDFLITRANTPELVGDVCYVERTRAQLMLSDLIYRCRLAENKLDGSFLNLVLLTPVGRMQVESDARGSSASMVKISQEHIRDWVIPVPPLDEQRAIVAQINAETKNLDDLRAATERTLHLLKERRAALIAAAVTGHTQVGGRA